MTWQVLYHSEGFLQKNNNSLHDDLELVLKGAEDPFLRLLVGNAAASDEKATKDKGGKKGGAKTRFSSVSGHFVNQLSELTSTLAATNSHFVRCVNPNKNKQADAVHGGHVLHQLRCSGMMEALRLMHAGFPTRCPYEDLYDRYKDMMPKSIASLDSPSFCEILLMALGLDKADYQLGITKVSRGLSRSLSQEPHPHPNLSPPRLLTAPCCHVAGLLPRGQAGLPRRSHRLRVQGARAGHRQQGAGLAHQEALEAAHDRRRRLLAPAALPH